VRVFGIELVRVHPAIDKVAIALRMKLLLEIHPVHAVSPNCLDILTSI
jgi:hypothetical protein